MRALIVTHLQVHGRLRMVELESISFLRDGDVCFRYTHHIAKHCFHVSSLFTLHLIVFTLILYIIISASLAIKAEQSAHVIEMSSTRVCPHTGVCPHM